MSHWTNELFEDHPELFLGELEGRVPQTKGEVDVLLQYLKTHGFQVTNLLDLNCGIGRHAIELGKRGIHVLGTDLSPRYLEIAKERAVTESVNNVQFRVADMRTIASALSDHKPFDGIINLYTSFGFYDENTNDDILLQCRQLVHADGFFVLETINRDWIIKNFQEHNWTRYNDTTVLAERRLDLQTSRAYTTWFYLLQQNDKTFRLKKEITIDHRVWSLHELIALFKRTGWKFEVAYPGLAQQESEALLREVKNLLVIARKAK